jgi:hypothetical protein
VEREASRLLGEVLCCKEMRFVGGASGDWSTTFLGGAPLGAGWTYTARLLDEILKSIDERFNYGGI